MTDIGRRGFLKTTGVTMLTARWASMAYGAEPHVVVVGGGNPADPERWVTAQVGDVLADQASVHERLLGVLVEPADDGDAGVAKGVEREVGVADDTRHLVLEDLIQCIDDLADIHSLDSHTDSSPF